MGDLTVLKVQSKLASGRYTDGDGLHLHVRPTGRKTWVFRYMRQGRSRDLGIGPAMGAKAVSLADARAEAARARARIGDGIDPVEAAKAARADKNPSGRTSRDAAERFIKAHRASWTNEKHAFQWTSGFSKYAYPVIGDRHVRDVNTEAVLRILQPIWSVMPETASRLRGRIEAVLDSARTLHWRDGENPARWKGHLATLLPPPRKVRQVEHHPSLPWQQLPAFLPLLRSRKGSSAQAIEFAILTAARSGEVRGMTRRELDLPNKLWTVPKQRMKAKRAHRVPLSAAALRLLADLDVEHLDPEDLVFAGQRAGRCRT